MTTTEIILETAELLVAAGITGGRTDAELIVAEVLQKDKAWLLAHSDDKLEASDLTAIRSLAKKRASRQPLSYVLGHREFAGLEFAVDARALTPRVETETIVAELTQRLPENTSVLDMGTGCGAIAISLKRLRADLTVTASEVSNDALELAHENAARLLPSASDVHFIKSDIFENVSGRFDAIAANLPYVARSIELMPEVENEPHVALFGGDDDGLALYRKFFEHLPDHLNKHALVFIESDPWQQPELIKLAASAKLKPIYQDYFILGFETVSN